MTGLQVSLKFVHQVAPFDASIAMVPEMVMRVDNRQCWVEGHFLDLC